MNNKGQILIEFVLSLGIIVFCVSLTFYCFYLFYASILVNHWTSEANFCFIEKQNKKSCEEELRFKLSRFLFLKKERIKVRIQTKPYEIKTHSKIKLPNFLKQIEMLEVKKELKVIL